MDTKTCFACKTTKPLEAFARNRTRPDGRHNECRECNAARHKRYYASHAEQVQEHIRQHRVHTYGWYEKNRERCKQYYRSNFERIKEYKKQNRKSYNYDPLKRKELYARRRARLRRARQIERIDRVAIIERDNSTCYLCGRVLKPPEIELDHVIPISRGGLHIATNLKVACRTCNARKYNKLLGELDLQASFG